jgi:DNA polymerase-3 subunit gamma/tau
MRDALVMLEQATSYGGSDVGADTVLDMLGLADRAVHEAFLKAIEQGDRSAVIATIDQLIERSRDLEIFLADVLELLRERLRQPSSRTTMDIRISQGLLELKGDLFRSLDRRIQFEIGVLALAQSLATEAGGSRRAAEPTPAPVASKTSRKRASVEPSNVRAQATDAAVNLSANADEPIDRTQGQKLDDAHEAEDRTGPEKAEQADEETPFASSTATPTTQTASAQSSLPENCRKPWETMLEEIQHDRIAIAAFLIEGSPTLDGNQLVISFHPDHSFHKDSLEMRDNLTYLAGAVRRHFGNDVHVEIKTDDAVERKPLPHDLLMEKARMVCKAVDGKIVKEDW